MFSLSDTEIEVICQAGSMAPSGGNAQPWKVEVSNNKLLIFLDAYRGKSFLDVQRFASVFGLGCFTQNVILAADHLGLNYDVNFFNDLSITDPVATFTFRSRSVPAIDSLYPMIGIRHTNRKLSDGTIIENDIIKDILAVEAKYGTATLASDNDKKHIAKVLGEADAIRIIHDELRKDMMEEFQFEGDGHKEGIELKTLEMPKNLEKMFRLIRDNPQSVDIFPEQTFSTFSEPLVLNCSHFCCLYIKESDLNHKNVFLGGLEMQKIWIRATKNAIALQPWSILPYFFMRVDSLHGEGFSSDQVKRIKELKSNLYKIFSLHDTDYPIFLFRLSRADAVTARSLHRDWKEFTLIKD